MSTKSGETSGTHGAALNRQGGESGSANNGMTSTGSTMIKQSHLSSSDKGQATTQNSTQDRGGAQARGSELQRPQASHHPSH